MSLRKVSGLKRKVKEKVKNGNSGFPGLESPEIG
jgi:hypothetical protein